MKRINSTPRIAHVSTVNSSTERNIAEKGGSTSRQPVLYGAVQFGYAPKSPGQTKRRLSRSLSALFRKRHIRRRAGHGSVEDEGDDAGEGLAFDEPHARVTRRSNDSGTGTGAGSDSNGAGGQGHTAADDDEPRGRSASDELRTPRSVKVRPTAQAETLARGSLQQVAQVNPHGVIQSDNALARHIDVLLDLRDELYCNPRAEIDVRVYEETIGAQDDKRAMQSVDAQRTGPSSPRPLVEVRQSLIDASRDRRSAAAANETGVSPSSTPILPPRPGSQAAPHTEDPHAAKISSDSRVGRLNLLIAAMVLNLSRPSTVSQLEHATSVVQSMRAAQRHRSS
jgi:hypothetical protein